jgi:hypothetical protein
MEKIYNIELSLYGKSQETPCFFIQGDANVYALKIRLLNSVSSVFVIPSGAVASISFRVKNERGQSIKLRAYADIDSHQTGTISYYFSGGELFYPGRAEAAVTIQSDGQYLTFPEFSFLVAEAVGDPNTDPPQVLQPWVSQIDGRITDMETQISDIRLITGYSPYIGPDGCWYVWDNDIQNYIDTGVKAEGAKGDTGDIVPQGERGAKGDNGDIGPQGEAGMAATISIGTVTTLPPGSAATVANSGTASAAVFDFGIPTGEPGAGGAYIPAESVDISPESAAININETLQLTAVVSPPNATEQTILWNISKPYQAIASVDGTGAVTAKAAGTATVTASTPEGISGAAVITVSNQAGV